MTVNELVEWVASILAQSWWIETEKDITEVAKQILRHPDLALKGERGFIYLIDAIKENSNEPS